MTPCELWARFAQRADTLHSAPASTVADAICGLLADYDDRLGVEVSEGAQLEREVIITAYGDPDAFSAAETLVQEMPLGKGWKFVALKPALGFHFTVAVGAVEFDASGFCFEPLRSVERPQSLGIRVYVPDRAAQSEEIDEVIGVAIQTGIGERRFAYVTHVEVAPESSAGEDALPIERMGDYIEWHRKRNNRDGEIRGRAEPRSD